MSLIRNFSFAPPSVLFVVLGSVAEAAKAVGKSLRPALENRQPLGSEVSHAAIYPHYATGGQPIPHLPDSRNK